MASPSVSPISVRILVVEDNDFVRKVLKTFLEIQGWQVADCRTGSECLEIVKVSAPNVVIVDLNLPDRTGADVVRRVRELSQSTRIVISSLTDEAQLRAAARQIGADSYFVKTDNINELGKRIAQLLSK